MDNEQHHTLLRKAGQVLCRAHLGSFGVGGDLALQPMYTLSGGQKSRVALAAVTFLQPHILLLDEPSNHLDLDAVQALTQVSCFTWRCIVTLIFYQAFITDVECTLYLAATLLSQLSKAAQTILSFHPNLHARTFSPGS